MNLNITNETAPLSDVLLGTAESCGPVPDLNEIYDPKSRMHQLAGTYPVETDMVLELAAFQDIFKKYGVSVHTPRRIENCNQIFARDTGFVIDDYFFKANILPLREKEMEALDDLLRDIAPQKQVTVPEHIHVEGGDVIVDHDSLFVGYYNGSDYTENITARTNIHAVSALRDFFPKKTVIGFELKKSNTNPRGIALHLDCCFQPVGRGKAILCPEGFIHAKDWQYLVKRYGEQHIFFVNEEEMFQMNCNIFSIAPDVVVSDPSFDRLNSWMHEQKITVEEVSYQEIGKQGGLFRCSTLPLKRIN